MTDRQGFPIQTPAEFRAEASRNVGNDRGRKNSRDEGTTYIVQEEARRFMGNHSIQHVASAQVDGVQASILRSRVGEVESTLTAFNDGRIALTVNDNIFDLTEQLASVGVTAAGIRRTQQDIASDGEVSRPEQTQIKTLIDMATDMVIRSR